MGCFVLWRGYGYFADGITHASMISVVLGSFISLPLQMLALINGIIFAAIIYFLQENSARADKSFTIGATSNVMMALSLILIYSLKLDIQITDLLFGDILSVGRQDLLILLGLFAIVSIFLWFGYRIFLLLTLSQEIAYAQYRHIRLYEFLFLCILAVGVIYSAKIIGVMAVSSMIIFPAITARLLARTPGRMIIYSVVIGQSINIMAIYFSFSYDLPFAATLVMAGLALYMPSLLYSRLA